MIKPQFRCKTVCVLLCAEHERGKQTVDFAKINSGRCRTKTEIRHPWNNGPQGVYCSGACKLHGIRCVPTWKRSSLPRQAQDSNEKEETPKEVRF